MPCDGKVHAANKLASRHARVWMCEVCEQAPASVTCKADAATLCVTCDRDIHSANSLARRHERFPVVPFYDPVSAVSKMGGGGDNDNNDHHYLLDFDVNVGGTEAEEAEAASWLLPNPNLNKVADGAEDDHSLKVTDSESEFLFNEINPYPDVDLKTPDQKPQQNVRRCNSPTDGVVPIQNRNNNHHQMPPQTHASSDVVEGLPTYDVDYAGSKPFMYNFTSQSVSQSVSSSSLEVDVGVVPDHNGALTDVSNNPHHHHHHHQSSMEVYPTPVSGFDREARVLRYREKRKNRRFEKTIRYASRKAYAETRPRIKGRFAKRTEIGLEVDDAFISPDSSYGIVPSY